MKRLFLIFWGLILVMMACTRISPNEVSRESSRVRLTESICFNTETQRYELAFRTKSSATEIDEEMVRSQNEFIESAAEEAREKGLTYRVIAFASIPNDEPGDSTVVDDAVGDTVEDSLAVVPPTISGSLNKGGSAYAYPEYNDHYPQAVLSASCSAYLTVPFNVEHTVLHTLIVYMDSQVPLAGIDFEPLSSMVLFGRTSLSLRYTNTEKLSNVVWTCHYTITPQKAQ